MKPVQLKLKVPSASAQELYENACAARENAHSPYSKHKVGAAILTENGRVYSGCNVENSSYGGTICAERTAIVKAVSEQGRIQLKEIVVVTAASPPWPPCGMCRQVISEFATPDTMIHGTNLDGETESFRFADLMPRAFTPDHLRK